jgi:hypothetical protein
MITEVFRKGMISTPNSPWNYGRKQAGHGTCDERPRNKKEVRTCGN